MLYLVNQPEVAFVTIGAVFLAVTGAEALYVDLGHFGRRPIVLAWLAIVFPCLLLNYFGQGAFVLSHGGLPTNPFFEMLPEWALLPMVILATAATVIASQAVISGAFSLTRQAVQLNLLPRFEVQHTSEMQSGQIYLPRVNMLLAIGVMLLVVGFGESSSLAAAYGISVTGEMLMTTVLLFVVMRFKWHWTLVPALALACLFGVIDIGLLRCQRREVLRWRLGVDRRRGRNRADHVDLDPGQQVPVRKDPQERDPARFPGRDAGQEAAPPGARHRRLPDQRSAKRADGDDAQPEALQGAARAERHPVGGHRAAAGRCRTASG